MNKKSKVLSSSIIRDSLKLSSSNIVLYLLPIVVTPILSRLYSPASFGEWGIFSSVYTMATVIIFFSYENAIVKTENRKDLSNLCFLCFVISILNICLIGLFFLLGKTLNLPFFSSFTYVNILLLFLLINGISVILINYLNRFGKYTIMSISNLITGSSQAFLRIAFGITLIFANGLVVGSFIAQILAMIFLIFCTKDIQKSAFWKYLSIKRMKYLAIENKKFFLYEAPATFLEFSIINLTIIILSEFFPKSEIGCFSIIIQLLLLPISFIGSAIGKVYYRQLSINNDPNEISSLSLKVSKITASLSLLPILFIALGGDKLITVFLGKKWHAAGDIALCLVLISVPIILSQSLLPIYRCYNKQDKLFKYDVVSFLLCIGVLLVTCNLFSNLYLILVAYSVVFSIIKFMLYKDILSLASINMSDIGKQKFTLLLFCIVLLLFRLIILIL